MTDRPRIAVLGTGRMGRALAGRFADTGYEVRVGSRNPERGRRRAAEIGAAFGGDYRTAAANADVVVLAVPFGAAFESLVCLGDLDGTVVLDVTNPFGDGDRPWTEVSCGELIQAFVPRARVVKGWNHLYSAVIRRSADFDGVPATVFLAGNDPDAKELVAEIARAIGYDPADAGPIRSARYLEPLAALMTTLDRLGGREHALRLLTRERAARLRKREPELVAPLGPTELGRPARR
jgi:8-hydroxy-5-deazaflavin:NADPH oxidoreductase